ncbi:MAG: flagellar hook assembly protein FlgD [Gammaproteobacteria bacterium]
MDKPSAILPSALDQFRTPESTPARSDATLGQEQFLQLMTTQLQNLDPFKPMESGDFLGQIAQFSTVSGISKLQESLATMASALQSSQALQASTMVGRDVVIPRDSFALTAGGSADIGATLPEPAGNVRVTVTDSSGQVMRQALLGQQGAGALSWRWDGLTDGGASAPSGQYGVRIETINDGLEEALQLTVRARVDSVTLGRNGLGATLNVAGYGAVDMADVLEIL